MKTKIFTMLIASVMMICSCSKDDGDKILSLNTKSISLYSTDTEQITANMADCIFESESPGVAIVSSSGEVTGICVGLTRIKVTKNSQITYCDVVVNPKYSMYKEPYFGFGSTKSVVKSTETRLLTSEDFKSLLYKGENSYIDNVVYIFENAKMTGVGCVIPSKYASLLGNFLAERYILVKTDISNNRLYYTSPDLKVMVVMEVVSTKYSMIAYSPASTSKSSSYELEDLANKLIQLMPQK